MKNLIKNALKYSPPEEKPDLAPSDIQPAGVDEEVDYNSLEEALTS